MKASKTVKKINKINYTQLVAVIFIAFMFFFSLIAFVSEDKKFSTEENRVLQQRPYFSISSYMEGVFEKQSENHISDQFPFRRQFIRIKSAIDITGGKLESNGVYRCRDNYLMEDIKSPDPKKSRQMFAALSEFNKKYKSTAKMYFLLAPNPANIMRENLPLTVRVKDQNNIIDKFYKTISSLNYKPIDVRNTFEKSKGKIQLYYRTDHHWTTDGAYIAYKDICAAMKLKVNTEYKPYVVKNDFRGSLSSKSGFINGKNDAIKIYLPKNKNQHVDSVIYYSDTKEKTTRFYKLDNLDKKDAYTVFGGNNHPFYTVSSPVRGKNLLLFKDSYANSIIPFIAQHYRKIVVVDPRYFYDDIDNVMKSHNINEVLFLYSANNFFSDESLETLIRG